MLPSVPERQIIVIMNFGKTGYLSDWAELHISNGKIELEKLVSLLTRTEKDTDAVPKPCPNCYDMPSMN
jgi:hypothetical protein